jgi:hypothetical protein
MRIDFSIHETGEVVSKYMNLGVVKDATTPPNAQLGPRTDYYKLWSLAVGRKPMKNEPMDPARIIGVEFLVQVGDKKLGGDGEAYSMVQSVKRELEAHEALSSSLNDSLLNSSSLSPQLLNVSNTQLLNVSGAQVRSTAQVPEDPQAHLLKLESRWSKAPQRTEAERALRAEYRKDYLEYRASLTKAA